MKFLVNHVLMNLWHWPNICSMKSCFSTCKLSTLKLSLVWKFSRKYNFQDLKLEITFGNTSFYQKGSFCAMLELIDRSQHPHPAPPTRFYCDTFVNLYMLNPLCSEPGRWLWSDGRGLWGRPWSLWGCWLCWASYSGNMLHVFMAGTGFHPCNYVPNQQCVG